MAVYEQQDVIDTPRGQAAAKTRWFTFSPGQIVGGLVGVVLVIIGVLATTRTGVDSTLNVPVTDVMGLTQSAMVGLVEVAAGLLLILAAANADFRPLMGIVGVLLFIGGLVVASGNATILSDIGATKDTGWFALVMGAIAIACAMVPTFVRSRSTART